MNVSTHVSDRPERLRLRVEDFELLEDGGRFADRVKAELIDGEIIVLNAQYARHGVAKSRLLVALANRVTAIGVDLEIYSEVSLRVAPDSMPEPDLFLAPRQGFGPVSVDGVVLVVEVSDTTLATDLGRKAELYAAAGIPEYWVIDVAGGRAILHADPSAERYATLREVPLGEMLVAATIPGLSVESRGLVG